MPNVRSTPFILLSPTGIDNAAFLAQLRSHPGLLCHSDMLGPLSKAGYAGLDDKTLKAARGSGEIAAFKQAFPEAYLYKYVLDSRGRQAVGFTVDHGTLLDPVNARVRNVLQHDKDVKVLMYAPRNILRAFVEGLGRQQAHAKPQALEVEPQKFLLYARQIDRMNTYVMRFFHEHAQLAVEGEGLLPDALRGTLKSVAKFLDLERFSDIAPATAPGPGLRDLIANFDALKAALRETPYARMPES